MYKLDMMKAREDLITKRYWSNKDVAPECYVRNFFAVHGSPDTVWVDGCIAHAKRIFASDGEDVGMTTKEVEEDLPSRLFMDIVTEVFKSSWNLLHHGRSEFTVEDILVLTGCTAKDSWKYTKSFAFTVPMAPLKR